MKNASRQLCEFIKRYCDVKKRQFELKKLFFLNSNFVIMWLVQLIVVVYKHLVTSYTFKCTNINSHLCE